MPEMKAIQQRYKHDKEKRNQELMKFYRDNRVNPAAPCLPLLVQFPVFIALYLVLRQFSKHPPGGSLSWFGGLVPDITGARERALVGLPAARDLRRQPARVDVLHVHDDGQDAADDDDDPPGRVRPGDRQLPGRARHLLGDDEPVDGRPGARHAPVDAEGGSRRRSGRSRTPPKSEPPRASDGAAEPADDKPAAPPAQPRRVRPEEEEGRGDDGGPPPGRGERRDRRRSEVGRAPRAREAPSGARQGRRSLPGRLRGRARAARRGLCAGAGRRAGRRGGRAGAELDRRRQRARRRTFAT